MRLKRLAIGAVAAAGVAWMATPAVGLASSSRDSAIPRYQHIVEIMMENQSYGTIIGSSLAPQINALANQYGLATNYYGVTHPSEPNYLTAVGGSFFGVQDDNQFRAQAEDMKRFYVRSDSGAMVPLDNLISITQTTTPQVISHYNLFRSAEIDGSPAPGYSSGQAIGAMDLLIAAHALALAATLVTNNLTHFQRISGLSVARWP